MHIGNEIQKIVKRKQNIDTTNLARKIGLTRQGLYEIYKKDDLNTKMLKSICTALDLPVTYFLEEGFSQNGNLNIVNEPQEKYGSKKGEVIKVSIQIEIKDNKSYNIPVNFTKIIEQILTEKKK